MGVNFWQGPAFSPGAPSQRAKPRLVLARAEPSRCTRPFLPSFEPAWESSATNPDQDPPLPTRRDDSFVEVPVGRAVFPRRPAQRPFPRAYTQVSPTRTKTASANLDTPDHGWRSRALDLESATGALDNFLLFLGLEASLRTTDSSQVLGS